MTFLQVMIPLLKSGTWLIPKLFEAEREKRGPSFWKRMKLLYASNRQHASAHVRVSISYLFRIRIDGRYLLVKGRRINQYQPVGGVYKHDSEALRDEFTKWDVREDKVMPIDIHSRDDLRVRVLGKNLINFLNWFVSEKDRETTQNREFQEELVEPGFLSKAFSKIDPRYLYTVWRPLTYSPHTQATELMVYQVYELKLTTTQEHELRHLHLPDSGELRWVTEEQIKRLGDDQLSHPDPFRIGHHACYLLSADG
jgi:SMODS-associated NUDIX domain